MGMVMGPRYQALYAAYVEELRAAKPDVNRWWTGLVEETLTNESSEEKAFEALQRCWPVGPAVHPRILAIVRKYYLACHQLNQEVRWPFTTDPEDVETHIPAVVKREAEAVNEGRDEPINPVIFVGELLATPETEDLLIIVGKLSYWPIGLDETGQFV